MGCVYEIRNLKTGFVYIGYTNYYYTRIHGHLRQLRSHTHPNNNLQEAFDTDGEAAFSFSQETADDKDKLAEREYYWITHYYQLGICYNIALNRYGRAALAAQVAEERDARSR